MNTPDRSPASMGSDEFQTSVEQSDKQLEPSLERQALDAAIAKIIAVLEQDRKSIQIQIDVYTIEVADNLEQYPLRAIAAAEYLQGYQHEETGIAAAIQYFREETTRITHAFDSLEGFADLTAEEQWAVVEIIDQIAGKGLLKYLIQNQYASVTIGEKLLRSEEMAAFAKHCNMKAFGKILEPYLLAKLYAFLGVKADSPELAAVNGTTLLVAAFCKLLKGAGIPIKLLFAAQTNTERFAGINTLIVRISDLPDSELAKLLRAKMTDNQYLNFATFTYENERQQLILNALFQQDIFDFKFVKQYL